MKIFIFLFCILIAIMVFVWFWILVRIVVFVLFFIVVVVIILVSIVSVLSVVLGLPIVSIRLPVLYRHRVIPWQDCPNVRRWHIIAWIRHWEKSTIHPSSKVQCFAFWKDPFKVRFKVAFFFHILHPSAILLPNTEDHLKLVWQLNFTVVFKWVDFVVTLFLFFKICQFNLVTPFGVWLLFYLWRSWKVDKLVLDDFFTQL